MDDLKCSSARRADTCVRGNRYNVLLRALLVFAVLELPNGTAYLLATLLFSPRLRAQPKRIREVDGVPARKPVEIQPAGEPNGVFLRDVISSAMRA